MPTFKAGLPLNFKILSLLLTLLLVSRQAFSLELTPFKLNDFVSKREVTLKEVAQSDKIVINFWASWCVACIQEMPELIKLKEKNPKVTFLAINAGESEAKIAKFLKRHSFPYRILMDQDKSYSKGIGVLELPQTIVIDSKRNILYRSHTPPKEL